MQFKIQLQHSRTSTLIANGLDSLKTAYTQETKVSPSYVSSQ